MWIHPKRDFPKGTFAGSDVVVDNNLLVTSKSGAV